MAPLIAPLFFPSFDPVVQLILAYGLLSTSLIERLISVFIFSQIAEKKGKRWTLSFSLLGAGFLTLCIGLIPLYSQIGFLLQLGFF